MKNSHTEEQLMQKVKTGDLDALAPLFEKYHVKLYNFFLGMIYNRDIAEDLTQDVFKRIIQYKHAYNELYSFKSWMYQIARNVMKNYFSDKRNRFADHESMENITDVSEVFVNETGMSGELEVLNRDLLKLNTEQRELIEWARFQGLTYPEISEITGNSVAALKVKMHRAVKKLREVYFQLV